MFVKFDPMDVDSPINGYGIETRRPGLSCKRCQWVRMGNGEKIVDNAWSAG